MMRKAAVACSPQELDPFELKRCLLPNLMLIHSQNELENIIRFKRGGEKKQQRCVLSCTYMAMKLMFTNTVAEVPHRPELPLGILLIWFV